MILADRIKEYLLHNAVSDVGFANLTDGPVGLPYAISLVVRLSDAVVDEIEEAPTFTYYHHYRTVNAFIDQMLLQTGLLLQKEGWRYLPIAASQSAPSDSERNHIGRYSHKKAAVSAGLGEIGKNALFLHHQYGARVRLGTLFTDCPLPVASLPVVVPPESSICRNCDRCVRTCPAQAIKGGVWSPGIPRSTMIDAEACNQYMREHFVKIGRGAVCGICVRVCPIPANVAGLPADECR